MRPLYILRRVVVAVWSVLTGGPRTRGIRLGHALGPRHELKDDSAIKDAVAICSGASALDARAPTDAATVSLAETILGCSSRPIYAYLGDLQPAMGTIGFIVGRAWLRRSFQGISKCDSGGMAARKGAFDVLMDNAAAERALLGVSTRPGRLLFWAIAFKWEVHVRHARGVRGYVAGDTPELPSGDPRARCVKRAAATSPIDRRSWTWEARLQAPVLTTEIECLVLSPNAHAHLNMLVTLGEATPPPPHIRVLAGRVSQVGVQFTHPLVRNALMGVA